MRRTIDTITYSDLLAHRHADAFGCPDNPCPDGHGHPCADGHGVSADAGRYGHRYRHT